MNAFLAECIGTALLVIFGNGVVANVVLARTKGNGSGSIGLGSLGLIPVALLVVAIGLSLGGTTGYAINPARDLGPRLVHALLPIAGKRDSDWRYAWIPVAGPILGGLLAAGVQALLLRGS